jgi:hypothetical protein
MRYQPDLLNFSPLGPKGRYDPVKLEQDRGPEQKKVRASWGEIGRPGR